MKITRGITGLILIALLACAGTLGAATYIVNPDGSGDYANIQAAVAAAVDGDTIALGDGTFTRQTNRDVSFLGKAIVICSQSGNAEACIIDVEGVNDGTAAERGFIFETNEGPSSILRDLTIINGSADAPCPACEGGGIYVYYSSPTIINVICHDNYAADGAAIQCVNASPVIQNCQFINNSAYNGGGFKCTEDAIVTLENCLISGNTADIRGGGVSLETGCAVTLDNCTITNNTAPNGSGIAAWESDYTIVNTIISFNGTGASLYSYGESDFTVSYSDIYGNTGGDWVSPIDDQLGVNGNISDDPLYVDTAAADFRLTIDSPCIDAGDPTYPLDPDSTIADMGAYYFDQTTGIDSDEPLPRYTALNQNYPNPFNAATTISFALTEPSTVELTVYDILGRQVAVLANGMYQTGVHQVNWNANVGTGIYFYRLLTDDYSSTKKMILLK